METLNRTLDPGTPVEIMYDFDTILFYGQLAKSSPSALTVKRIPDEPCFPILKEGIDVIIRGYDSHMDPVLFLGTVTHSSGLECSVGELRIISYQTHRKHPRYPLCPAYTIDSQDDLEPDRLYPVQLLNISTGGACIVSGHAYAVGQTLRLLAGTPGSGERMCYHCRVERATPRRGHISEYGLSFVNLTQEQHDSLARLIEAVRDETKKRLRL